jgi:ABC-type microcin C transport system duplicated ATPase subunit YejF
VFIDNHPADRVARRRLRRRIQMVFQDPYASLNPRWRAGDIVAEPIRALGLERGRARVDARVGELLRPVGLDPADGTKYPHEFSGASASALRSRERSHHSRTSSSAMSQPLRSTYPCRRRS